MQIRELYLKNFGKFSEKTFLLQDGIHVFYGENEFGKSTLYTFIKGMLFGMERARGRASKNDTFSQYEPWDNPNYYAGVMRFESGGRMFRIERSFDKITKSSSLICEDDGEELSIEQGDLDVLLEGMTESSFENTFAIGQLGVQTSQDLAVDLKNYAANYYEAGSSEMDVQAALDELKQKQKMADQKTKQETLKKERIRNRIAQEYEYVKQDFDKLKNDELDVKQQLHMKRREEETLEIPEEEVEEEPDTGSWTEADYVEMRQRRKKFIPALVLFLMALAGDGVLIYLSSKGSTNLMMTIVTVIVNLLFIGYYAALFIARRRLKQMDDADGAEEETSNRRESSRAENSKEHLRWELGRIRANMHEKQVRLNNLNERLEELELDGFVVSQNDAKSRALQLASETIEQLSEEIIQGFGHTLNEKASDIISAITEGKYTKLYIDDKLNMFLLTKEKRIPAERLSRGTLEQVYFALRMAAMDILYEESFPVILDDTFVFYDEHRLEAVLKWLTQQERQVILFTCQKRELEIFQRLGIEISVN